MGKVNIVNTDITIIGAGPAGLAAAIESAKLGADVVLIDENSSPGGQLFKQIHKFFGSKEHYAKTRGIDIGQALCNEAKALGVNLMLSSVAFAIYDGKITACTTPERLVQVKSKCIILALGANENTLSFKGWVKPGVITAGAAQTIVNIYRVLPGKSFLMVGSGNVGLIVSYQLLQAGAKVAAIIEALPKIGGYGVHAAKVSRAGVPILTSHTILEAKGEKEVSSAIICRVDEKFKPIMGSEKELEVDVICLAVGLTPQTDLARIAGCSFEYLNVLGGFIPIHDKTMETTVKGIYVAGDTTGVEEASTAIDEGRIAGIAAASSLGLIDKIKSEEKISQVWDRLNSLRIGPFGESRKDAKKVIIKAGENLCL
jgi:thioredoxin reductase